MSDPTIADAWHSSAARRRLCRYTASGVERTVGAAAQGTRLPVHHRAGLMVIDEAEGMPFCRTPQLPGAGRPTAPDRPSAVDLRVSLMLVLLRRRLLELDAQGDRPA